MQLVQGNNKVTEILKLHTLISSCRYAGEIFSLPLADCKNNYHPKLQAQGT